MSGRHGLAAFPGDLAFGARPHRFASFGNDSIWRAMDRTIACPLQCRGTRGSGRFAPPQRCIGNNLEARPSGEAARPSSQAATRWRAVVEPQGGGLDGGRTRPHIGRGTTWMGGFEGDRLVDPEATPKEPEIGFACRGRCIQKKLTDAVIEEAAKHPGKPIEVFATDEHRIGLKPVTRRVWAPIGKRPIAHGHHRFDWLYVTAFVSPATGETFWYLSNGVSKEFFEALLETFAREAEAGLSRIILLVLDNAGWHGPANLKIPDGIRLIHLPPYSPELQPAETLWALVDEPIINKHIATIEELDAKIASQCVALAEQREQIRTRTGFHWWPKPINPN